MDADESLRLKDGLEPPHSSLPDPGPLMRQLGPIVRVPTGIVRSAGQQLTVGHCITSQFVRHDRSRLAAQAREQAPKEAPGGCRVSSFLKQYVDDFTILVHGPAQVPLLASYPDKNFVQEEAVTVAAVSAPQSMCVPGSELVAPEADRLVGDEDPLPSQEVLDVSMAEVEAVVEPDGVLNDLRRKSVPPV